MSKEMKVTAFEPKQALKISHRRDNGFVGAYIAIDKKGDSIAEVRLYQPKSNACACAWVHYGGQYANGSGVADGGGYDKKSAAAAEALQNAGIVFADSFAGTGRTMEAMEALGRKLAGRQFLTVVETFA